MKNLKQWLLVLMASFVLVGIATGCSSKDTNTDGKNTEENQNNGTGTEDGSNTGDGTGTETNGK